MSKILSASFLIIQMIFLSDAQSQNLVPNYSFENYHACPKTVDQLNLCNLWFNPNSTTTPDYYNACDSTLQKKMSIPKNVNGVQLAHTGNAYVGISTFDSTYMSHLEYIQTELLSPLKKGVKYKVSLYLSLAEISRYHNNQIQFCFSKSNKMWKKLVHGYFAVFCEDGITVKNNLAFKDTNSWNEISTYFYANGGESFLTIGVFYNGIKKKDFKSIRKNHRYNADGMYSGSYYYIDDVSVVEVASE